MRTTRSFPRTHRLHGRRAFAAVFAGKAAQSCGPLTLYALPNNLPHPRLGIVMSRSIGPAVRRNRLKRLLREAFRLSQHDLPGSYDFIVIPRPHEPLILMEYHRLLLRLGLALHRDWQRPLPRE